MNDQLYWGFCQLLWLFLFLISWGCYSLRDFSRSRLEEVCTKRGRPDRFGVILRLNSSILLGLEILKAALWVTLVSVILRRWSLDWGDAGTLAWLEIVKDLGLFVILAVCFGVVIPWGMSRVAGEEFLDSMWPFLRIVAALSGPLVDLSNRFDRMLHRIAGLEDPESGSAATITEEIRSVMEEGEREGLLEEKAISMIDRVMDLPEVDVADIMTPRTSMVVLENDETLAAARELFIKVGHSRIPVIGDGIDDIVGVLYAKDLLKYSVAEFTDNREPLATFARKPFYVPETMRINKLLEVFKIERVHAAVVLDEYGGVAGMITMEDILEEIVGDIADEHDHGETESIREIGPGQFEIPAGTHIDDVNDRLELEIPNDEEVDTLGGFVFSLMGRVPVEGEQIDWGNVRFTVQQADKRQIKRLRLELRNPDAASPSDNSES